MGTLQGQPPILAVRSTRTCERSQLPYTSFVVHQRTAQTGTAPPRRKRKDAGDHCCHLPGSLGHQEEQEEAHSPDHPPVHLPAGKPVLRATGLEQDALLATPLW